MAGQLQAITSIPWGEVLTGACASCAALILPALMAAIAFVGMGPDARRRAQRPTPWVQSDLVQIREEIDRVREALIAAEAHLLAGGEVPAEQAERTVESEEGERLTKAVSQLRTALTLPALGHLRRPWWVKVLQVFAQNYLMYLFFFLLGVLVTLLVARLQ